MSRTSSTKDLLHPKNKHRAPYDFEKLVAAEPWLAAFIEENKYGTVSIDFFNTKAVVALNRALLKLHYNINNWSIPENFLCPPIPGRVDYIHYVADLLASENNGAIPTGNIINCFDVGTGASCIYPLLGNAAYGWSFVGSDNNVKAFKAAKNNLKENPQIAGAILLEIQNDPN